MTDESVAPLHVMPPSRWRVAVISIGCERNVILMAKMARMTMLLILGGVVSTACAGSSEDDPVAAATDSTSAVSSPATTSETATATATDSTPADPSPAATSPTYIPGERLKIWVNGRAVPVAKQLTTVIGNEDAPPIYGLGFEAVPQYGGRPMTLPSGYKPQANPTGTNSYLDYLLPQGFGAGPAPHAFIFNGLEYTARWLRDPNFKPVTSMAELHEGIRAGHFIRGDNDKTPYWDPGDTVLLLTPNPGPAAPQPE